MLAMNKTLAQRQKEEAMPAQMIKQTPRHIGVTYPVQQPPPDYVDPPIEAAKSHLSQAVGELSAVLSDLENRLIPVVTPMPEGDSCSPVNAPPPQQLSTWMDCQAQCVSNLVDRVRSVLQRLELP